MPTPRRRSMNASSMISGLPRNFWENRHTRHSPPVQREGRCTVPDRDEKSSRGGEVDSGFRERRQGFVGLLFLLQGLIQQPDRILHAELRGPLLQGTVAGDFVVFDGL